MTLRIACVQFAPVKAEVDRNLNRIAALARQAFAEGARVIVFPETATTGYFLEGGVTQVALTAAELREALAKRLDSELDEADLIVGFYRRDEDSGEITNASAHFSSLRGAESLIDLHDKLFLPTYGVFDEERFLGRGNQIEAFGIANEAKIPSSMLICEDIWHSLPPTIAALRGAHVLFVPSASPARGFEGPEIANREMYRRLCRTISAEHGVFVVNSQLVGFEGGKGLIGGSVVTDPYGRVIAEGPVGEEAIVLADLDLDLIAIARAASPMLSDLRTMLPRLQNLFAALD